MAEVAAAPGAVDADVEATPAGHALLGCPEGGFRGRNLHGQNFSGDYMPHSNFCGANLHGANFNDSYLRYSTFYGATANGASFSHADASDCDFYGATVNQADFRSAALRRCRFYGATMSQSNFARADATNATFYGANVLGSSFYGATLRGATLTGATSEAPTYASRTYAVSRPPAPTSGVRAPATRVAGARTGPVDGRAPCRGARDERQGGSPPASRCCKSQSGVDMCVTCEQAMHMSTMVQIRNVPDALHRKLKARAALAGMSLSDYILAELKRSLDRPTREEFLDRLATRSPVRLKTRAADAVREAREQR